MRLTDKVVVVTGSTRGIGRAIVEACAREGAAVIVSSRHEAAVDETRAALLQQGWRASGLVADVAVADDVQRLLQHAIDTWGRVDVWVNNAGLSAGLRNLADLSPEEIAAVVAVNLTGTIQACRLVIPYFLSRGSGILLNMSGRGGRGEPSPHMAVYAATKAAVTSLTRSVAQEYRGRPISIHAVIPGMVATDFYRDIATSPELAAERQQVPYALAAFGVPVDEVARVFVQLAAQEPGRETGKVYSLLKGPRLARGIGLMLWYRLTGRLRSSP